MTHAELLPGVIGPPEVLQLQLDVVPSQSSQLLRAKGQSARHDSVMMYPRNRIKVDFGAAPINLDDCKQYVLNVEMAPDADVVGSRTSTDAVTGKKRTHHELIQAKSSYNVAHGQSPSDANVIDMRLLRNEETKVVTAIGDRKRCNQKDVIALVVSNKPLADFEQVQKKVCTEDGRREIAWNLNLPTLVIGQQNLSQCIPPALAHIGELRPRLAAEGSRFVRVVTAWNLSLTIVVHTGIFSCQIDQPYLQESPLQIRQLHLPPHQCGVHCMHARVRAARTEMAHHQATLRVHGKEKAVIQ